MKEIEYHLARLSELLDPAAIKNPYKVFVEFHAALIAIKNHLKKRLIK